MARDDIRKELEELRAQLTALQAERDAAEPASPPEQEAAVEAEEVIREEEAELDVAGQLKELMETLEEELKDANPKTLLAVFALGILIGRLLAR